ncbi:hypothetical protein SAMN06265795_107123 [Noviherbaspirillum humi]|uniref:Uncharacterized protein n=1 Tax=Noviherbaspirillum humi TaxID=1688639 RepID=A0A239HU48_9BURK|nr:hypothetical protein [Noviherbaspirillum humi]SNS83744.1 hypothetical protein SAMN06265795_107123 [Noviherbaspirillum humi]
MRSESLLMHLAERAASDPLLEIYLLTAIDAYTESLAGLDDAALRDKVLERSPRRSRVGIDAAAWGARADLVRRLLAEDFGGLVP